MRWSISKVCTETGWPLACVGALTPPTSHSRPGFTQPSYGHHSAAVAQHTSPKSLRTGCKSTVQMKHRHLAANSARTRMPISTGRTSVSAMPTHPVRSKLSQLTHQPALCTCIHICPSHHCHSHLECDLCCLCQCARVPVYHVVGISQAPSHHGDPEHTPLTQGWVHANIPCGDCTTALDHMVLPHTSQTSRTSTSQPPNAHCINEERTVWQSL